MFEPMLNSEGYYPAHATRRWGLGLDIGQAGDPSAVTVMEKIILPVERAEGVDWLDQLTLKQRLHPPVYHVRHLERLPLGMAYPDQVDYVVSILAKEPLRNGGTTFAMDKTGVGRGLFELWDRNAFLIQRRMRPVGITITAGREDSQDGCGGYHVAKQNLVARIQAAFHARRLKVAPGLKEAPVFIKELQSFVPTIAPNSGNISYGARQGAHDDLLLSCAVILWVLHGASKTGWSIERFL